MPTTRRPTGGRVGAHDRCGPCARFRLWAAASCRRREPPRTQRAWPASASRCQRNGGCLHLVPAGGRLWRLSRNLPRADADGKDSARSAGCRPGGPSHRWHLPLPGNDRRCRELLRRDVDADERRRLLAGAGWVHEGGRASAPGSLRGSVRSHGLVFERESWRGHGRPALRCRCAAACLGLDRRNRPAQQISPALRAFLARQICRACRSSTALRPPVRRARPPPVGSPHKAAMGADLAPPRKESP
ncbi:hypothetical protein SAMN05880557_11797 [Pseudacidovorax sp. RU35E]|nr:hypothetical protein SAMN05880557_11797 [Pseudacidovorax sp. RU35E]